MVIPLMKQAADEPGTDEQAALHCAAVWADGAACAVEARRALQAFLAHVPCTGRTPVPAPLAIDAQLVVSELVTNAIRHAPGPCGMLLRLSDEGLAISVWDTSAEQPVVRKRDGQRFGGHGMHVVHAVSAEVAVAPFGTGKQITACLRPAPDLAPDAGTVTLTDTGPAAWQPPPRDLPSAGVTTR
ncbi:ATP-binding protein [Streptomyces sp. SID5643]|uniref:ATP-binding protein n=1 Tax=Streptomyces sp. SID5643 TaxID=2690307 RepID=UPI0013703301|nr:ATP-binding protein [Streptomyces sp. SID5643]MZF83868.1 ATP-binding protein [Streptomyces sp. SID5643]